MTDEWAIAIVGAGIGIVTTFLGWIATEIRSLHADLRRFVVREDCSRWMEEHEKRIDQLDELVRDNYERLDDRVRKHGWKLAAIEECHNRLNPNEPLSSTKYKGD